MMLVETDATVSEIAKSVGYKDSYYFSRLFKKNIKMFHLQNIEK